MQFTPQQMSGGGKYSSVTRIGNWAEEIALEDAKLNEFKANSKGGSLGLRKQQNKIAKCKQAVPVSYSEDGFVHFGDMIQLQHFESSQTLACDPYEDIFPSWQKYQVSLSQDGSAVARNVFTIMKPPGSLRNLEDDPHDNTLRYGQPFLLKCNDSLLVTASNTLDPTLYMASTLKNERTTTKTNKQAVYMSSELSAESVWMAVKPSGGTKGGVERFMSFGMPLEVNDPVVLVHRATNSFLSTNPSHLDQTDFGFEAEVFADRQYASGKISIITAEFKGTATGSTISKKNKNSNLWMFCSGPENVIDDRVFPTPPSLNDLLCSMRTHIKSFGMLGFIKVRKLFVDIDRAVSGAGDGKVDVNDVKILMNSIGIDGGHHYYGIFYDKFSQNGLMEYRKLMRVLRGPISLSRSMQLDKIYDDLLVKAGGNDVKIDDLRIHFKSEMHPMVIRNEITQNDALNTYFLKLLDIVRKERTDVPRQVKATSVSRESFIDLFSDYSAAIDDDDEFTSFLDSVWQI